MFSLTKSLFSLTSATTLMLLATVANANTLNVSPGQSIQAAIDAANPGDTILIAPGTYYENLVWNAKDLVIQGAGADRTIINGNASGQGYGGTCLQTSGLSASARLEGVTLTRGVTLSHYSVNDDGYVLDAMGGGMRNIDSHPTVANCVFTSNNASGGLDAWQNYIRGYGGGMDNLRSNPTVISCTFTDNSAEAGGGIANRQSHPTISGCTFRNAHAVYNEDCAAPGVTITGCLFDGCDASIDNLFSSLTMTNCAVINGVSRLAPAIFLFAGDVSITGCLIANNQTTSTDPSLQADIAGVAIRNFASLRLTNCTIVGNHGGGSGVVRNNYSLTVANCILWGNTTVNYIPAQISGTTFTMTNSDNQDLTNTTPDASGNFAADPLFVDAANGDFHLRPGSPCLNAGSDATILATGVTTDLDGNPRISGSAVDMGVFEKFIDSTPPVITTPGNLTATATSVAGAVVTYSVSATDDVPGAVTTTSSPASGTTFPLGKTTVQVTATDAAGNQTTASFDVTVTYSWSGFLQPINADGSSVFKAGSTVPVKFQLTGASAPITNAVAKLGYARVTGGVVGDVNEATSTAAGDSGNFRYDASTKTYIFNWSTKGIAKGTYQLSVDLGDGVSRLVNVGLK